MDLEKDGYIKNVSKCCHLKAKRLYVQQLSLKIPNKSKSRLSAIWTFEFGFLIPSGCQASACPLLARVPHRGDLNPAVEQSTGQPMIDGSRTDPLLNRQVSNCLFPSRSTSHPEQRARHSSLAVKTTHTEAARGHNRLWGNTGMEMK